MIRHATLDSVLGPLLLATGPRGMVRVAFPEESLDDVLAELEDIDPDLSPGPLDEERTQLEEYLAGTRHRFELPVDLSGQNGFTRDILHATSTIPYASTSTYGAVAAKAGCPRGARAAGNALNQNPIPFIIPCHRVIRASGEIGGYAGHEDRKAWLLSLEGAI